MDQQRAQWWSRRGGAAGVLVPLAVVLLVGGGVAAWLLWPKAETNDASSTASDIVPASVRSFDVTALAPGSLKAAQQIELRSQLDKETTVVSIVPEGTRVTAGEVIFELNGDSLVQDITQEELAISEARLNLAEAETAYQVQLSDNASQLRKAELALELARLALRQWEEGDDKKERQRVQLAIEKADRELTRLTDKFQKSEELFARKFISKDERDTDEIAYIEAKANLQTALLERDIYETFQFPRDRQQKISDVEEAEAELERVKKTNEINLRDREGRVENRRLQLKQREDRLAELTDQLEKCKVVAPSDGLVVYGSTINSDDWRVDQGGPIAVGRQVYPNELIVVLPNTAAMNAVVDVPEALAGQIRPGQVADITIDAVRRTVRGEVQSIGVLAQTGGWRDPNRRDYSVTIRLLPDQDTADLKPSMRCDAKVVLQKVEPVLTVPVQAVFNEGRVRYVYLAQGGVLERQPVKVSRISDQFAEVVGGLSEGERVLIREPEAREVVSRDFDPQELAALGYLTATDGAPGAAAVRPVAGEAAGAARGRAPAAGTARGLTGGEPPAAGVGSSASEGDTATATSDDVSEADGADETAAPATAEPVATGEPVPSAPAAGE